jgi:hypothetical protein
MQALKLQVVRPLIVLAKGIHVLKNQLIKYLLGQELTYAAFCVVIALLVSFNHGFYPAIKAFGYCFLFLQPVILFINRGIVMELFGSNKNK